jgi:hypothetical protein
MIRKIFVLGGLLALLTNLSAQNLTLSPYSRFGIGEIFQNTTARNMAMGDIGQATLNYASVNRLNPASYADLFYTTLDVSGFAQLSQLRTRSQEEKQFSAGFQNIMFGFPSNGPISITFGFAPYSAVGYDISSQYEVDIEDSTRIAIANYKAEGGLNQAFLGVAGRMLKRKLRLGLNAYFTFGNLLYRWQSALPNESISNFANIEVNEDTYVSGLGLHGGFIYADTLAGKRAGKKVLFDEPVTLFRIGGSVDHAFDLTGDRLTILASQTSSGTILDTLGGGLEVGSVSVPTKYGLGISITQPGHWEVSAEATLQNWQSFRYFSDQFRLSQGGLRLAMGGEWIPNISSAKYFSRMAYRLGVYRNDTYLTVDGNDITDLGFTFGLGFPASRKIINQFNREVAYSRFNLGFGFGRRGRLKDGLPLEELYFRVRVGITMNERWFRKVRID